MAMKKSILILVLVPFFWLLAAFVAESQDLPIRIEVGAKDPTVALFEEDPPTAGHITVTGKIQNVTKDDLPLSLWTCSFLEDWSTDNKAVLVDEQACLSNYPKSIILKTREIHEELIPLTITKDIPNGDIHFKLCYNAYKAIYNPQTIPHDLDRTLLNGAPFCSKDIALHVRMASDKRQKYWHDKEIWFDDFHTQDQMTPEKDGVYKRHYFTGELFDERTFKNRLLHGPYKQYFQNGTLEWSHNYKEGKLDGGQKTYNEKGQLTSDELYSDGELVSYIHYKEDGSIHADMKFMKKEGEKYVALKTPCTENDSDKEVLSMFFAKCNVIGAQ